MSPPKKKMIGVLLYGSRCNIHRGRGVVHRWATSPHSFLFFCIYIYTHIQREQKHQTKSPQKKEVLEEERQTNKQTNNQRNCGNSRQHGEEEEH